VETSDVKAFLLGAALLALGFFVGRKARSREEAEVDSLRSEMRSARDDSERMRSRLEATERESASSGRTLRALLDLLPGHVRAHIARDNRSRDPNDGGNGS